LEATLILILDKAKPFVRRARKAAGLIKSKVTELAKDELFGNLGFLYHTYQDNLFEMGFTEVSNMKPPGGISLSSFGGFFRFLIHKSKI